MRPHDSQLPTPPFDDRLHARHTRHSKITQMLLLEWESTQQEHPEWPLPFLANLIGIGLIQSPQPLPPLRRDLHQKNHVGIFFPQERNHFLVPPVSGKDVVGHKLQYLATASVSPRHWNMEPRHRRPKHHRHPHTHHAPTPSPDQSQEYRSRHQHPKILQTKMREPVQHPVIPPESPQHRHHHHHENPRFHQPGQSAPSHAT